MKKLLCFMLLFSTVAFADIDKTRFAVVNIKTIAGVTYTAYRSIDDPTQTYVESNGEWLKVNVLKDYWKSLDTTS